MSDVFHSFFINCTLQYVYFLNCKLQYVYFINCTLQYLYFIWRAHSSLKLIFIIQYIPESSLNQLYFWYKLHTMDCVWTIYGLCMDYVWTMYGLWCQEKSSIYLHFFFLFIHCFLMKKGLRSSAQISAENLFQLYGDRVPKKHDTVNATCGIFTNIVRVKIL